MQNFRKKRGAVLEITGLRTKKGQYLTFDPLPPAKHNFWKHDI